MSQNEVDLTVTANPDEAKRTVRYVSSDGFVSLLSELRSSLILSTYHAGKVVVLGTHEGRLVCEFHNFELAMGLALHSRQLAVGTRHDIWFLQAAGEVASIIEPQGRYDTCLVARKAVHTGTIHGHEMAFIGDELWIANTLFSCLCTLDEGFHFVPRWKPAFISEIKGPDDRCHLNGLAVEPRATGPRVKYVTCLGQTNTPGGWREDKATGGVLVDVESNEIVVRGLSMPHSPRVYDGRVWVLDSGRGELQTVDVHNGQRSTVERFPGYTRGLAFLGPYAFVALSQIRETNVFGGLPISERRDQLKCGLAVVDLRQGRTVATFEFLEGVEELFDVKVLPNIRCPALRGPHLPQDDHAPIWIVPPLES
jgi:uncharacterized protein (TIGR03032 family)